MNIFNHLHANFAQQFGPAGHVPPLPWDDDGDDFFDDVDADDLPLPISFPLGTDAE